MGGVYWQNFGKRNGLVRNKYCFGDVLKAGAAFIFFMDSTIRPRAKMPIHGEPQLDVEHQVTGILEADYPRCGAVSGECGE